MRSRSSGHAFLSRVSWSRKPSLSTYLSRVSFRPRATNSGSSLKMARMSRSVSSHDFHAATHLSMSSCSTGASSSISRKAVEASVPIPTLKPCDTEAPLYFRCSMSHRWLNWCSAPEAGRLDCVACMAKPLNSSPSASCSTFSTLPACTPAGSDRASFSPSCTNPKAKSSIGSDPTASESIQSAPAGILAIRSA